MEKIAHHPQREVGKGFPQLWISETGVPSLRQAEELTAIEPIERVHDEDPFEVILLRQNGLIGEVGALL